MTTAMATLQSSLDDRAQLATLRHTLCEGANDSQFAVFVTVCKHRSLDPWAKQVHCIIRGGKMTIQTAIDGFRVIAERSGKYQGQTPPQWCGPDGKWCEVWLSTQPPAAARIGVFRAGWKEPCWGIARFASYSQGNDMWRKMGDNQLAKCAEALALRKAFPEDLSGIYTDDEMAQADVVVTPLGHAAAADSRPTIDATEEPPRAKAPPPNAKEAPSEADKAAEYEATVLERIARAKNEQDLSKIKVSLGKNEAKAKTPEQQACVIRLKLALNLRGSALAAPAATPPPFEVVDEKTGEVSEDDFPAGWEATATAREAREDAEAERHFAGQAAQP